MTTREMIGTRAFPVFAAVTLLVQGITLAEVASAAPPAAAEMRAELAAARDPHLCRLHPGTGRQGRVARDRVRHPLWRTADLHAPGSRGIHRRQ